MLNMEQLYRDTLAADTKSAELHWSLCFGTLQNRVDRNIPNEAIVTTEPPTVGKNSFRFIISDPIEALTTLYYLCLEVWIFLLFCRCWMNSLWEFLRMPKQFMPTDLPDNFSFTMN